MSLKKRIKRALHRRRIRRVPQKTEEGRFRLTLDRHEIDVFLDVGANRGQTGRMLRSAGYRGRIVSFEPIGSIHQELVQAAKGDPGWQIAPQMALGSEDGEATINVSETTEMSSLVDLEEVTLQAIPMARVTRKETILLHRLDTILDDYAERDARILLKIDTQGFERQVLEGCSEIMDRIVGIKIELSLLPLYRGELTYEYWLEWMDKHGFEVWLVEPVTFSKVLQRHLQIDAVFFRRSGEQR